MHFASGFFAYHFENADGLRLTANGFKRCAARHYFIFFVQKIRYKKIRTLTKRSKVRIFFWWRRGESNPCPKSLPHESLRAQFPIGVSTKFRSGTNPLRLFRCVSLCVTGRGAKVSCMVGILRARQAGAQRTLAIKPPRQNQILRLCLSTV